MAEPTESQRNSFLCESDYESFSDSTSVHLRLSRLPNAPENEAVSPLLMLPTDVFLRILLFVNDSSLLALSMSLNSNSLPLLLATATDWTDWSYDEDDPPGEPPATPRVHEKRRLRRTPRTMDAPPSSDEESGSVDLMPPLLFWVYIGVGTGEKKAVPFQPSQSLREILERVCEVRQLELAQCRITTMAGAEIATVDIPLKAVEGKAVTLHKPKRHKKKKELRKVKDKDRTRDKERERSRRGSDVTGVCDVRRADAADTLAESFTSRKVSKFFGINVSSGSLSQTSSTSSSPRLPSLDSSSASRETTPRDAPQKVHSHAARILGLGEATPSPRQRVVRTTSHDEAAHDNQRQSGRRRADPPLVNSAPIPLRRSTSLERLAKADKGGTLPSPRQIIIPSVQGSLKKSPRRGSDDKNRSKLLHKMGLRSRKPSTPRSHEMDVPPMWFVPLDEIERLSST